MIKKDHHISAPLFFTLLAIPYAVLLCLILQQQYIKFQMRERIEQENQQTVVVLASAVKWVDYPKEALIEDRMFDIKELERQGDTLVLKGLFDDEETLLVDQMVQMSNQKEGKGDVELYRFFQLLNSVFYQAPYEKNSWQQSTAPYYPDSYCIILPKLFLKVPTPPPQAT